MSENRLGSLKSPYLLQHADHPVHWQPWGEDAFEQARAKNKPILLSIGYAACHWCHVMAHESFADRATAQVMNALYINVKVDREEHPDVDAIYQKALMMMGQQGGWPLTMFLTPAGEPFWGGTYFPTRAAYGRPSFVNVLQNISNAYAHQKDDITQNVTSLCDALIKDSQPKGDGSLTLEDLKTAGSYILRVLDPRYGGMHGAPKFPQPVLFDFLWRVSAIKQDDRLADLVELTLKRMCLGGIYDQIGGGFARYSTDAEWLAPHFEKMLYDNAQLISLMTLVWRKTRAPLLKQCIADTIDWVFREMSVEGCNAGFALASALDADSEGMEGKFYVWSEQEIDELLGEQADSFKQTYDVTSQGNWEGHTILRRVLPLKEEAEEKQLTHCRQILLKERAKRIHPQRDDKVLCDWNCLMIKALCEAGAVFDRPDWIDKAKIIMDQMNTLMVKDGVLYHSWCAGHHTSPAYLDDYAQLCQARLALYNVTGEASYLTQAENHVRHIDTHFWDEDTQGYNFSANQTINGLNLHPKPILDTATPSGNGVIAIVLADLFHLSGKKTYQNRLTQLVQTFGTKNPNDIFAMPSLCSALIRLEETQTVCIIGDSAENDTKLLIKNVYTSSTPHLKILLADGKQAYPIDHPLHKKSQIADKPTAYVCRLGTCSPPVTDPTVLASLLTPLGD
ncbi:thioredoxin domain-containing protein [Terasakiella pusilla]|uniref:thioredoxin domain-containing protein n=1 Tax=Terasakiella pusilla TaxID=64973 RepID=UPI003AA7F463